MDVALTYSAVGATRDPGAAAYPPAGFRPLQRRALLGHGDDVFRAAGSKTMAWGIQRGSGFRVLDGLGADADEAAVGQRVRLLIPFGPFRVPALAEVVYLVDEPRRRGFAYGTLPGHPESGEEAFLVEQDDDGSVWITIRAFSRPASWFWWVVNPVLRLVQEYYTRRYLRALL